MLKYSINQIWAPRANVTSERPRLATFTDLFRRPVPMTLPVLSAPWRNVPQFSGLWVIPSPNAPRVSVVTLEVR
jgi:hypothetical protein